MVFNPPNGQKLDTRFGPSTQVVISSSPPELLLSGAGTSTDLDQILQLNPDVAAGVLHITARAASCDTDESEFPACHVIQQDWGVPVEISAAGERELRLMLAGI